VKGRERGAEREAKGIRPKVKVGRINTDRAISRGGGGI